MRYKLPEVDISKLITYPVLNFNTSWENTSDNFRFYAAVAEFGLLIRESSFRQNSNYQQLTEIANNARSSDENMYRDGFVKLVKEAATLQRDVSTR